MATRSVPSRSAPAGTLTFPIDALARLAQHAVDSREFTHGYDVLFDAAHHKGGKIVEKDGWPDKDNIDKSTLKPALMLVKDQGVYMMSNGIPAPPRDNDQHVVYATEADPKALPFDTWYESGRRIMGGDDTVITLFGWPEEVLKAQAEGAEEIQVSVTRDELKFIAVFPKQATRTRERGPRGG